MLGIQKLSRAEPCALHALPSRAELGSTQKDLASRPALHKVAACPGANKVRFGHTPALHDLQRYLKFKHVLQECPRDALNLTEVLTDL